MSDRDAFVRRICEEPVDDTARLVFADWLDENDDPGRAEFIRVQCELATLPKYEEDYPSCQCCDGDGLSSPPPYHRSCRNCHGTGKRDHKEYRRHLDLLRRSTELLRLHEREWRGGGVCGWCEGTRTERIADAAGDMDDTDCRKCHGTGWACWPLVDSTSQGFCPRCSGSGRMEKNGSDHRCGDCQGSGNALRHYRISATFTRGFVSHIECPLDTLIQEGVAAAVWGSQPVEEIVLTDIHPHETAPGRWWLPVYSFPVEFDAIVTGGDRPILAGSFDTREAAMKAMSRKLVAHGRTAAGLPPLPSGQPAVTG